MIKNFPKTIFTGGGSGGHLMIIKGMIDYLRNEGVDVQSKVLVVGGKLGMISDEGKSLDEKLIPTFGVPYRLIRGGKLHRAFKLATIRLLFGVFPGFFDAYKVVKEFNPQIIFAAGGYVTLPVIIVSKLLGKKVVIHEQTISAGLANKIGAFFADKVLVSFNESAEHFPKNKTIITGNVVRKEVVNIVEKAIHPSLKLLINQSKKEGRPVIYITGGSLGAHRINQFVINNINDLLEKYSLIWQTGDNKYHNDWEKVTKLFNQLPRKKQKYIYLSKFIGEEIGYIFVNSDLVVCRPGANVIYELAIHGKKALMIPLWVTSKSDQNANALWYKNNFKGEVLNDGKFNYMEFVNALTRLLNDNEYIKRLENGRVEKKIIKVINDLVNN